jgi:glutathione S-transferase
MSSTFPAATASLTISSKNYSSWALRGWLLCKLAKIDFVEDLQSFDDPSTRAELLHLTPSFLVPKLTIGAVEAWGSWAIAEVLNEINPQSGLLPESPEARAHCRSICGEMHSGFTNLRAALPMNLKAKHENFKVWAGAKPDIQRICAIWRDCLKRYGGPYLFGAQPTMADAMFAPVCSRFQTYSVELDLVAQQYCKTILQWDLLEAWRQSALNEPDELEELDLEF